MSRNVAETGSGAAFPLTARVETDAAGATVVARRSIDAEGYSTTLLALGIERGLAFARERDAILGAYFVDRAGKVAGIA